MGVGPNYNTNKGFLATGATAYAFGEIATVTGDATVARATTINVVTPIVVVQEDLDTVRLATGKAFINCALEGLVRVQAGAAVAIGDRVTNDATARAIPRARTAAGSQLLPVFGIALTAASAAGDHIDVLLTQGALF
jgi:hypothetical protein